MGWGGVPGKQGPEKGAPDSLWDLCPDLGQLSRGAGFQRRLVGGTRGAEGPRGRRGTGGGGRSCVQLSLSLGSCLLKKGTSQAARSREDMNR